MSAPEPVRTPYADPETPDQLSSDCRAAERSLRLAAVARDVRRPAPSLRFEDFPQRAAKHDVDLVEAAHRLARALQLDHI